MYLYRKTFFLAILLLVFSGQRSLIAQSTQELESFKEIKVFDGISVSLIRSDKNEAVIRGANTEQVAIVIMTGY